MKLSFLIFSVFACARGYSNGLHTGSLVPRQGLPVFFQSNAAGVVGMARRGLFIYGATSSRQRR